MSFSSFSSGCFVLSQPRVISVCLSGAFVWYHRYVSLYISIYILCSISLSFLGRVTGPFHSGLLLLALLLLCPWIPLFCKFVCIALSRSFRPCLDMCILSSFDRFPNAVEKLFRVLTFYYIGGKPIVTMSLQLSFFSSSLFTISPILSSTFSTFSIV